MLACGGPEAPRKRGWTPTSVALIWLSPARGIGDGWQALGSAAVKQLRKGLLELDTFAAKMFCSGSPGSLWGRDGIFLIRETPRIRYVHLSSCGSVQLSLCSIHLPTHLFTYPSVYACWGWAHRRGLDSPVFEDLGLGGDSDYNSRCHCVTQTPGTMPSAPSTPAVLNQGQFCPPGDIWQCLQTFLVVIAGGYIVGTHPVVPSPQRPRSPSVRSAEAEKP